MQKDNLNKVSQTRHLISSSQERDYFSFGWNSYIYLYAKEQNSSIFPKKYSSIFFIIIIIIIIVVVVVFVVVLRGLLVLLFNAICFFF